ncbi:unnamed protein product [Thlaspi arvense]|uniref:C3H1-type domain-containing protein n=1 Tax=Thlaspi arvense TaxID=13288 RepID=A0AAU9SRA3_THLAR|nr:unnamed protein product [Thlaspi arvense]
MGEDELSHIKFSPLLESSACNDLSGFKSLVEEEGLESIDRTGLWYGRRIGSKKMGFEERTPLMVAALFGSKEIVEYIISTGLVDVNRSCGSDGATALHCAVSGLSANSLDIVNLLLNGSADPDPCDAYGNKPVDMIFPCLSPVFSARKKVLERLLKGSNGLNEAEGPDEEAEQEEQREVEVEVSVSVSPPRGTERKEYPVDPTLPDIKNGIYGTDEFRMYAFKIKPCSRAYSHDWTECPFVHPGENARRRDPRKYHYSCVPCPEFRKGSCPRGDSCEYAHGIFECWLHPAQYRTRLCKDETNCSRRVCFFAHKPEELRPLYPSTGSGVPSPRSSFSSCNSSAFDMGPISPLPPLSPNGVSTTPPLSPNNGGKTWMNWPNITPPALQLPGSRLKSALHAREIDFSEDIQSLSTPTSRWNNTAASPPFSGNGMNRLAGGGMSPVNSLCDMFGTERSVINQQMHSNSLSSSPVGANSPFSLDSSTVLASRAAAFATQRSQSFIERSNGLNHHPAISSMSTTCLNDWGSLDGKLDWSVHGDELQKLRKSTSFRLRAGGMESRFPTEGTGLEEPDVSWVEPLVKEPQETRLAPVWMEQSYMETEQTVA